jgi:hypothetical protein
LDRASEHHLGGILGLCELIREYPEACHVELLQHGLRLTQIGTGRCTWIDVRAVFMTAGPRSVLTQARQGHHWTPETYILADIFDTLAVANWQRSSSKKNPQPKPKRYPRPGDKPEVQVIGKDPIPISEFDAWWDSN